MMKSPVNQMSPAKQFLLFVAVFGGIFLAGNLLGFGMIAAIYGIDILLDIAKLNFSHPQSINALYILQVVTTTIPIFLAPVVFAKWIVRDTNDYIKPTFRFPWLLFVIAFFIMALTMPLIEFLSNMNQQMILPKWLGGLEKWMKDSEESARRVTEAILKMDSVWDCIKNVLLIGFLTAVAEEFMFRGVLQTIFEKWTKNTHIAIWVVAVLFSAFHMEFYGFFPRTLLGAIFGYFVAYSGSIWPAIWGHFLNNATAVISTYLYQKKLITLNPDETNVFNTPGYLFSLIIIINLLLVYKKVAQGRQKPLLNGEELG
ncbi:MULTISPECIES: type II CAAX endopeptidase family protein [unclassified Mucilaginibacter]|uniref:CPBP family intramembrane glutamic endopeptidase n=1 Tax=unclassified Mucilaginibacter TaxID=2617802 RepID=UPI002AC8C66D|nr:MULTISPECIES: type II CAAX endopeptidase family protein [unclassified Mucilaginibacter]MEB0263452.1 type II CAAX endopeptidase family protein [Mucilaginibacter sp. 10I4]MEB0278266.1 type II CAAX endopeptidase family protein [Mucilaginibacter sp. 10B2]MEB0302683.1 type II CAAX endopeptidase family protein [Mucilaginibacter sp. 5C4]WPX23913.1 type II CAAX endopeptidase family protein [Mucilaginibacter sp. 5C4]